MRILLTNDDGINAPGFAVLERIARQLSDDIWCVAPADEQSGAGHSLTLTQPLRVHQYNDRRFAVKGTPTDSVMMALGKLVSGKKPDLLLSGVNRGANIAEDVTYSGTVSAAMEGTLAGIKSIALSQATVDRPVGEDAFEAAETHAPDLITKLLQAGWPESVFININFPPIAADVVKGVHVTEQGFRDFGATVIDERIDQRGFTYYWFGLGRATKNPRHETDIKALKEGFISVTPLHLDLTHRETLGHLRASLAS